MLKVTLKKCKIFFVCRGRHYKISVVLSRKVFERGVTVSHAEVSQVYKASGLNTVYCERLAWRDKNLT